jgi:hypothetical protein
MISFCLRIHYFQGSSVHNTFSMESIDKFMTEEGNEDRANILAFFDTIRARGLTTLRLTSTVGQRQVGSCFLLHSLTFLGRCWSLRDPNS